MKIVVILSLVCLCLRVVGQRPPQDPIPEFVLVGKTDTELRLMRNEIFARYEYIFKSEDLTEYFSQKSWYSPSNTNVDDFLSEIDKQNNTVQRKIR